MAILIAVRTDGDIEKYRAVDAEHPELLAQLRVITAKHGIVSHRRYYREGQILDLDEWESEDAHDAFVAEAQPIVDERMRLREAGSQSAEIWHSA